MHPINPKKEHGATYYNLQKHKGLDTEQLVNLMNLQDLDDITNLNELVSLFDRRSRTALVQMAPIMTKTITIRHKNP